MPDLSLKDLQPKRFGEIVEKIFEEIFSKEFKMSRYSRRNRSVRKLGFKDLVCTDGTVIRPEDKPIFTSKLKGVKVELGDPFSSNGSS